MTAIIRKPDTVDKLKILSADAQYDLACACGSTKDEHRKRGEDGKWIYPVTLPNGGRTSLLKSCFRMFARMTVNTVHCGRIWISGGAALETEETVRLFSGLLQP